MTDTITIPRAIVHQVLDALERTNSEPGSMAYEREAKASVALEDALRAAPQQQAEPAYDEGYKAGWSDAQPRQQAEPVAWMAHQDKMLPTFHRTFTAARDWADNPTPLYTAPSQRKPLTVKEINALPEANGYWPISMNDRILRLIRAAEAAHGIKGGT